MAKNENAKSKAEIYREERKERLAKAAKKNATNAKARKTAVSVVKKVVAAVIIVAILGGIAYGADSTFGFSNNWKTAMTVGEEKISVAQFNYYYKMAYNYYAQMESTYAQQGYSLGFDTSKAPDEVASGQKDENGADLYWDDIIREYAISSISSNFAFYQEAVKNGYKLTPEEVKEIDEAFASMEETAKTSGMSLNAYIRDNISRGLSKKGLRELVEIETLASRYEEDLRNAAFEKVTDEEITAEYEENAIDYNYTDVSYYQISTTLTKETGETDEAFNERKEANKAEILADAEAIAAAATDIDAFGAAALEYKERKAAEAAAESETEENAEADAEASEDTAADAEAETDADAEAAVEAEPEYPTIEKNGLMYATAKTAFSEDAADWAFAAERQAGEVKVFEGTNAVYIIFLVAPSYEGNNVNVRHLLIKFNAANSQNPTEDEKKNANEKLNTIITEAGYTKDENGFITMTEEQFIELAKNNSEDTTASNGGLIENVTNGSNYVENFKNWSMDKSRQAGDCQIIETEYGYHLMYFVEVTGPDWKEAIREELQNEKYEEDAEKVVGESGPYKTVNNDKNIDKAVATFCDETRKLINQQALNNSYGSYSY